MLDIAAPYFILINKLMYRMLFLHRKSNIKTDNRTLAQDKCTKDYNTHK